MALTSFYEVHLFSPRARAYANFDIYFLAPSPFSSRTTLNLILEWENRRVCTGNAVKRANLRAATNWHYIYIYVTKYTHNIIYIHTQYIEVLLSRLGSGTTLRAGEYGQYTGSRWGNN